MLAQMKLLTSELLAFRAILLGKPLTKSFLPGRNAARPYAALVKALSGIRKNTAAQYFARTAGIPFDSLVARADYEARLLTSTWADARRSRAAGSHPSTEPGVQYELEYKLALPGSGSITTGDVRMARFDSFGAAMRARVHIKTVASDPCVLTEVEHRELLVLYGSPGAVFVDETPRVFKIQTRELLV
jgi:hypothetical protein